MNNLPTSPSELSQLRTGDAIYKANEIPSWFLDIPYEARTTPLPLQLASKIIARVGNRAPDADYVYLLNNGSRYLVTARASAGDSWIRCYLM